MDEREIKILTDRLIPVPKEIAFNDGEEYIIVKEDDILAIVE